MMIRLLRIEPPQRGGAAKGGFAGSGGAVSCCGGGSLADARGAVGCVAVCGGRAAEHEEGASGSFGPGGTGDGLGGMRGPGWRSGHSERCERYEHGTAISDQAVGSSSNIVVVWCGVVSNSRGCCSASTAPRSPCDLRAERFRG